MKTLLLLAMIFPAIASAQTCTTHCNRNYAGGVTCQQDCSGPPEPYGGGFSGGYLQGKQLLQEQRQRELEIERQKLENERLRRQLQEGQQNVNTNSPSAYDGTEKYIVEAGGYCNENADCVRGLACRNNRCLRSK